jgi:hypothetical protein
MATFNGNSATNNVNQVIWGWSTKLELRTDRASGSVARHGVVGDTLENLGTGVAAGEPFTLLS